jgi:hypothetical protein
MLLEALSFIVLVLLSLVGYSAGAAGRAGKGADLKPALIDLFLVLLIWGGAVFSRLSYDFNKLLLILVWVLISAAIGMVSVSLRRLTRPEKPKQEEPGEHSSALFKRLWEGWKGFSRRMGSFQSRVLLSFFFFLLITPIALLVKAAGDPLRIKKALSKESFWLTRAHTSENLEDFRRQF